jgi:hypothetical protein
MPANDFAERAKVIQVQIQVSAVSTVTVFGPDDQGSIPARELNFIFATTSRTALRPPNWEVFPGV